MGAKELKSKPIGKKDDDAVLHSGDEQDRSTDASSGSDSESESESGSGSGSGSDSSSSGSESGSDSSSDSSSDSDSSSSDSDGSSSDDDSDDDFEKDGDGEAAIDDDSSDDGDLRPFLKDNSDSDAESSDDEVRVVKSQKDKKFEELESTVTTIENATRINDWGVISTEFDKLNRLLPNLLKQNSGKTPKLYIKTIADVETAVTEAIEKQKVTPKRMNAANTRGLNTMRQKTRKINKDHASEITSYRKDPEAFMTEEAAAPAVSSSKRQRKFAYGDVGAAPVETVVAGGEDEDDGFTVVGSGGRAVQYTPESIFKHLRSVVESRGRKNTDREEQVKMMVKLFDVATTDYQRIRVLLTMIPTRFDMAANSTGNHMSVEQWKAAETEFKKLFELLVANRNLVVVEDAEEWDNDDVHPPISADTVFKIPGSILSFVERLDDEMTRSLQQLDPHTADYVERLKDESALYAAIVRAQLYAENLLSRPELEASDEVLNRVVVRRLEHVYFKPTQVVSILESNTWEAIPANQDSTLTPRASKNPTDLVAALCSRLYVKSEGIMKTRALLSHIYFLSLHDEYYSARDMMLMSHLQELIPSFDVATQILYNRALVQVGLCAFRAGNVRESQSTLQEICGSNRLKELLAQGLQMQRYSQLTPEQEKVEKLRQLPFHMHINLELLECVYLVCSMLLEIPLLAQIGSAPDNKRRVISKTFRRLLEYYERQVFTGHPENTRDHIMQASKALATGEWRQASDLIQSIKIWELMPQSTEIKAFLAERIQIEGLRTYLFTYAPFYDTLSIQMLAEMFDLTEKQVSSLVSEMVSHEDIRAALDQVTRTIRFSKDVEVSRLQSLAAAMSEKALRLMETNEKMVEQQTGGSGRPNQGRGGRGGRGGGGGGGRDRERRD